MKETECLIIGGGPAGLTAAIYLGRFKRNVLVIDKTESRASLIPESHNYPGFSEGISGAALLARLRSQAGQYGANLECGMVIKLEKNNDFLAYTENAQIKAKAVLMATGIIDKKPNLTGIKEFIYKGKIRFCPVCDGYESMNKKIGIIGLSKNIIPKALFLRTYSRNLVLLPTDKLSESEDLNALRKSGIEILNGQITHIDIEEDNISIQAGERTIEDLDILYPSFGYNVLSHLAQDLGANTNSEGYLVTDAAQCTSVPGLYAAGDVTLDLSQITVALGQATIAAVNIHKNLSRNFIEQ